MNNEAFERAKSAYGTGAYDDATMEFIFPQITDSEDEMVRKWIVNYIHRGVFNEEEYPMALKAIEWLEKQKEQKPADFPTTDEEVNEFLETHSKVEVPEKYKTPDFVFSKQEYESYPIISKDTTSVKPAEWSEEDEEIFNNIIEKAKGGHWIEVNEITWLIAWFKSLRPVGKEFLQPHWKPSEDEERLIKTSISFLKDFADKGYENAVECIDWLKSKLNGDACK